VKCSTQIAWGCGRKDSPEGRRNVTNKTAQHVNRLLLPMALAAAMVLLLV
jgi:hypothetical protein